MSEASQLPEMGTKCWGSNHWRMSLGKSSFAQRVEEVKSQNAVQPRLSMAMGGQGFFPKNC